MRILIDECIDEAFRLKDLLLPVPACLGSLRTIRPGEIALVGGER